MQNLGNGVARKIQYRYFDMDVGYDHMDDIWMFNSVFAYQEIKVRLLDRMRFKPNSTCIFDKHKTSIKLTNVL